MKFVVFACSDRSYEHVILMSDVDAPKVIFHLLVLPVSRFP